MESNYVLTKWFLQSANKKTIQQFLFKTFFFLQQTIKTLRICIQVLLEKSSTSISKFGTKGK